MIADSDTSRFRTWIKDAQPEDLLTIAALMFSRIGTLDSRDQERFIQEVQRDPQAKRVLEKMQSSSR